VQIAIGMELGFFNEVRSLQTQMTNSAMGNLVYADRNGGYSGYRFYWPCFTNAINSISFNLSP